MKMVASALKNVFKNIAFNKKYAKCFQVDTESFSTTGTEAQYLCGGKLHEP